MTKFPHAFAGMDIVVDNALGWARFMVERYADVDGNMARSPDNLRLSGQLQLARYILAAAQGHDAEAQVYLRNGHARILYGTHASLLRCRKRRHFVLGNLDTLVGQLLKAIATRQQWLVRPFLLDIFEAIEGGWGVHDGNGWTGAATLAFAAMGLSIIGRWLDIPIDLAKHKLPMDSRWTEFTQRWDDPDERSFLAIAYDVCEKHVERIGPGDVQDIKHEYEFSFPLDGLYPSEVLAALELRRLLGLSSTHPDHEILRLPYAIRIGEGAAAGTDKFLTEYVAGLRIRKLPHPASDTS